MKYKYLFRLKISLDLSNLAFISLTGASRHQKLCLSRLAVGTHSAALPRRLSPNVQVLSPAHPTSALTSPLQPPVLTCPFCLSVRTPTPLPSSPSTAAAAPSSPLTADPEPEPAISCTCVCVGGRRSPGHNRAVHSRGRWRHNTPLDATVKRRRSTSGVGVIRDSVSVRRAS